MRVTTAFSRLLDLPGVWVRSVELRARSGGGHGRVAPSSPSLPEVLVLHASSREQAASRLGLAAPRSRRLAAGGSRPAAAAALPRARRARGGRPVRPRRRPVHARLREPRRVAGDEDRQDRDLPADADRLADDRADHRARRRAS